MKLLIKVQNGSYFLGDKSDNLVDIKCLEVDLFNNERFKILNNFIYIIRN